MRADSYTAYEVFQQAQQLLVPQFQRPYVWDEQAQWAPLWEDIETQTSRLLAQPGLQHRAHFLGAIVLQQQITPPGRMQERTIIDGQQRLTTLQILIDAVQAEMESSGASGPADFLRELIENDKRYRRTDDDRFKLLPTNRDRPAYREVMGSEPPIDYSRLSHKAEQIPKAHRYFALRAKEFLTNSERGNLEERAEALATAIREFLRMVVISLEPDEDAQEIFETLNSRGTPLSAADLIKNFLFQRLLAEHADVEEINTKYWSLFETAFWEKPVSVGRRPYPRAALFLTHYLVSRVGEPILATEVFHRFKTYVSSDWTKTTLELIQELHRLATDFEQRMTRIAATDGLLDPVDTFLYRTQVMEIDVVTPLFLLLTDPSLPQIPKEELHSTLRTVESWIVRRGLTRATTKRYNQVISELIGDVLKNGREGLAKRFTQFFTSQTSDSSYWPDNKQVSTYLANAPIYTTLQRGRLRMILEALEDDLRGMTSGRVGKTEQPCPRYKLTVEHVLPQQWRDTWGLGDSPNIDERERRVHVLGNLTLLTQVNNSSVSNAPWLGEDGKKRSLEKHGVLLLNRQLEQFEEVEWQNSSIDRRTESLVARLLQIWPVPEGHSVTIMGERRVAEAQSIGIAQLLGAGLIEEGAVLVPTRASLDSRYCVVLSDGTLETDDQQKFWSPSGAGRHVTGHATSAGWHFWRVQGSNKRLFDLREEYRSRFNVEVAPEADETDDDSDGD